MAHTVWPHLSFWSHLLGAVCWALLAVWVLRGRQTRLLAHKGLVALVFTALWCIAVAAFTPFGAWTQFAESARNLSWLWVVYCLFVWDGRCEGGQPVRPVLMALVVVELFQAFLLVGVIRVDDTGLVHGMLLQAGVLLRLLAAVGALVLVHNLYAGASVVTRELLKWPVTALAAMWVYDLNFYTIAYLGGGFSEELAALRGVVVLAMTVPLALAASRNSAGLKLKPSRAVAFQSLSLLVIGVYIILMVALAQAIALIGGDLARLTQVGFVFAASVVALLWLPSEKLRRWLRVTVVKHLFQHRYDYRAEWLRFTRTIGRAGSDAAPLHERAIQAVADITDSPGGILLVPDENGALVLGARWQCADIVVPGVALDRESARFFEREGYILDLDDLRAEHDMRARQAQIPAWLLDDTYFWAMVPLIYYERLTGIILLARPAFDRLLDWEDFDLLRVVGQQLASYLAEQAGQEALNEATRFDEFNRRIAFVMHDIKNLASQLSLLAHNAERHAENPDFRADMLVTLRNSADKLNALLARLGRYGAIGQDMLVDMPVDQSLRRVVAHFAEPACVVIADVQPCRVQASPEALEQALVHLVQNAIEASDEQTPVYLRCFIDDPHAVIEVIDTGSGMSPEFIRTSLFKPFVSSKNNGFGIGAFEARELIRGMNGQLDVASREGLGTRFFIRLPLSDAGSDVGQGNIEQIKVA